DLRDCPRGLSTGIAEGVECVRRDSAATGVAMPDDFRVSITNPDGKDAYPIASFTWLLLYQNPTDKERARVMVDFLKWAITDGQKFAPDLGYAPLPQTVVDKEMAAIGKVSS